MSHYRPAPMYDFIDWHLMPNHTIVFALELRDLHPTASQLCTVAVWRQRIGDRYHFFGLLLSLPEVVLSAKSPKLNLLQLVVLQYFHGTRFTFIENVVWVYHSDYKVDLDNSGLHQLASSVHMLHTTIQKTLIFF